MGTARTRARGRGRTRGRGGAWGCGEKASGMDEKMRHAGKQEKTPRYVKGTTKESSQGACGQSDRVTDRV